MCVSLFSPEQSLFSTNVCSNIFVTAICWLNVASCPECRLLKALQKILPKLGVGNQSLELVIR